MKEIDVENWNRQNTYKWFKSFSNSTYGCNVKMDVTKLVEFVKKNNHSFFIDTLYLVVMGLDSVEEMRMRLVDDKPVIFDKINPAFTVMTESGTFENLRYDFDKNYKSFYETSQQKIQALKSQNKVGQNNYNPENCYNEYYITCTPWLNFEGLTQPIPDNQASQCVPRICWGKYIKQDEKYYLTLNIAVSHIFVDGYPLAQVFNNIQELFNNVEKLFSIFR